MLLTLLLAAALAAAPRPVVTRVPSAKTAPAAAVLAAAPARAAAPGPEILTSGPWLSPALAPAPLFTELPPAARAAELSLWAGRDEPKAMQEARAFALELMARDPLAVTELARRREAGEELTDGERHAVDVAVTRSMIATLDDARRLHGRFFPEFERSVPLKLSYRLKEHAWGFYDWNEGSIGLAGPTFPTAGRELERSPSPFRDGRPISSRVARLVIAFHEYAHALFYAHTGALPREDMREETVLTAVNEGFAVMLELLVIDKMLAERASLGLSDEEAADLGAWKKQRIASLKRDRNMYTEGTLRVWHSVYRDGGEKAMLAMLGSLVPERMVGIPMSVPFFKLAGGETALLRGLTRQGDEEWEQLVALSNHVLGQGAPPPAEVVRRVRPAALARFFDEALKLKHPAQLGPSLRLALLDERAARIFYDRLTRLHPSDVLGRGPAWVDGVLGVLPYIKGAPDWRALAEKWIAAPADTEDKAKARSAAARRLN